MPACFAEQLAEDAAFGLAAAAVLVVLVGWCRRALIMRLLLLLRVAARRRVAPRVRRAGDAGPAGTPVAGRGLAAVVVVACAAGIAREAARARVLFLLQPARELLVLADAGLLACAVGVVAAEGRFLARPRGVRGCTTGVAGGSARGRGFAWGVDGFCGLLPDGLLGVDVDEEPLVVLLVPDGLPALGYLGGRRALCRVSLLHSMVQVEVHSCCAHPGPSSKSHLLVEVRSQPW